MKTDSKKPGILVSRLKLILVISVFLGPLLASFIWYYGFDASQAPAGQSNHAPLIQPAVPLEAFENRRYDQQPADLESLQKVWTVVHLVRQPCGDVCRKSLYNTRQTRIAVGKDGNRIQRYLILQDPDLLDRLRPEHADASFLIDSGQGLENQIRSIFNKNGIGGDNAILIDPLGNAMMVIPADLDPRLLLKDLKKLLKISRIG